MTVLDPETLQPTPADGHTMGEIMFRGNIVMKGYLKNPSATAKAFEGGWFHTGDLAVMEPDRYVKIKDRSKDIIISGGENISSIEVEDALYRHAAVMACAVLWGNLTFNPISALSHATLEGMCQFPLSRELAAAMMTEAQTVAGKLGISFRVSLEKRIAGAEKVGKHKTSMLQDVEAGRAPEVDALVGSVVELARLTETPTPHIDTVYALVKLLAHSMAQQGGR
ncbi:hypothetical protein B566_EDAN019372, partial [Ephemera danica]